MRRNGSVKVDSRDRADHRRRRAHQLLQQVRTDRPRRRVLEHDRRRQLRLRLRRQTVRKLRRGSGRARLHQRRAGRHVLLARQLTDHRQNSVSARDCCS